MNRLADLKLPGLAPAFPLFCFKNLFSMGRAAEEAPQEKTFSAMKVCWTCSRPLTPQSLQSNSAMLIAALLLIVIVGGQVTELKEELKRRGLDQKGVKAVLVERLENYEVRSLRSFSTIKKCCVPQAAKATESSDLGHADHAHDQNDTAEPLPSEPATRQDDAMGVLEQPITEVDSQPATANAQFSPEDDAPASSAGVSAPTADESEGEAAEAKGAIAENPAAGAGGSQQVIAAVASASSGADPDLEIEPARVRSLAEFYRVTCICAWAFAHARATMRA